VGVPTFTAGTLQGSAELRRPVS